MAKGPRKHPVIQPGQRYGRWTVVREGERRAAGARTLLCRCDCGTEKIVDEVRLRNGRSRSCGCLRIDSKMAHGYAARSENNGRVSRTYNTWYGMVQRCTNPNSSSWRHYGGRGIRVCDQWLGDDGILNFVKDMGERPEGRTLDRIDVNGDYEPSNCRWATPKEQRANQRPRNAIWKNDHAECARRIEREAKLAAYNGCTEAAADLYRAAALERRRAEQSLKDAVQQRRRERLSA